MAGPDYDGDEPLAGLAGRERELARLSKLLDEAFAGHGRVAFISGEAGIGKTALVEAIVSEAGRRGAIAFTGGCYDLTTTPPYGPWGELLRGVGARVETDLDVPPPPPLLDRATGDAPRDRTALFEGVAGFVAELTEQRPIVLVLEDMHWSDDESIDLLRHVARRITAHPVLLLVTHREATGATPSAFELAAALIARESRADLIRLRPLDRRALDALVARRFQLDDESRSRLGAYLERASQGNPLYAVELLRGLQDDGVLQQSSAEVWRLGQVDETAVPRALLAMLAARIQRLPEDIAHHLRAAAVIGQDVELALWRAVAGIGEGELIDAVEALADAGLIVSLPSGAAVRFRHALVHQAAYQSILPARRRLLHRIIAEALEASPNPDPDQVAWHYRQAGDARVASWLVRAAERAQRGYAWNAAAERLIAASEASRSTDDPAGAGWLAYRIGRLRRHADPSAARRWLEDAERLGTLAGDAALVAYARFDQGHVRVLGGDYERGLAMMSEGDALLEGLDPGQLSAETAAWIADALPEHAARAAPADPGSQFEPGATRRGTLVQWLAEAGRFEEVRRLGEPYAIEPAELGGRAEQELSALGDAWYGLGRMHAWLGNPEAARESLDRALECYQRIDHHLLSSATSRTILTEILIPYMTEEVEERERLRAAAEAHTRRAAGVAAVGLIAGSASLEQMLLSGQWHEAFGLLRDAPPGGNIIWRHRAAALLARLERERGNPEEAWRLIRTVLPADVNTPPGTTTYQRAIDLQLLAAELALDAGDLALAERWLDAVDAWLAWGGVVRGRAEARLIRSRWLAARGNLGAALALVDTALAAARSPRQPLVEAACLRTQGKLHTELGQHGLARERLEQALAIAETCAARYEIALSRCALADALEAASAGGDALGLLVRACDELEEIGAERALGIAREQLRRLSGEARSRPAPFGLSKREIEVLTLVASGMTDGQVAEELSISYRTVTTHLTSIFTKLNVSSRVAATRIAVEHGIV